MGQAWKIACQLICQFRTLQKTQRMIAEMLFASCVSSLNCCSLLDQIDVGSSFFYVACQTQHINPLGVFTPSQSKSKREAGSVCPSLQLSKFVSVRFLFPDSIVFNWDDKRSKTAKQVVSGHFPPCSCMNLPTVLKLL